MLLGQLVEKEIGKITGTVRGHCHYHVYVGYGSSFGFTVPSWKLRDDFSADMGLASISKLGWVEGKFDGKDFNIQSHNIHTKGLKHIEEV
jgi:hypothetical protein